MKINGLTKMALVALAAGVALAGCSATGQDGDKSSASSGKTLTIWSYQTPTFAPIWKQYEETFLKTHPGVTFKYLNVDYNQLRNKVLTAAVGQDGPDVLVFDPADTAVLAKAGTIKDIDSEWKSFKDRSQFPEALQWKYEDHVYAVQGYVNTTALYYNKDTLAKAGIEPPTTIEELGAGLAKVNAAGDGGFALCGAPSTECETQALSWILGQGGNYDDLDAPGVKEVFDTFGDWSKRGYIPKDAVTWTQADAWDSFVTGKFAFAQAGNWNLGIAKDLPFNWGVVPLPGAQVAPGGEGEAVGGFSDNSDLAFDYLAETFWTANGQLIDFKARGTIPARADVAESADVQRDPNIAAWTKEIANAGARPAIKGGDITKATTVLGRVWSSVLSGQLDTNAAIDQLKQATAGLF